MESINRFVFTDAQKIRYKELILASEELYPELYNDAVNRERMAVITANYIINNDDTIKELKEAVDVCEII
jgi:hypothetical protein